MRAVAAGPASKGTGTSPGGRASGRAAATRTPGRQPGRHASAIAMLHPTARAVARDPTPKKTAPPFYDEIVRTLATLAPGHRSVAPLRDLLTLAQLVDAGSVTAVSAAVTTFLASGHGIGSLEYPSRAFSDALISRTFLMGLPGESRRLREFFVPTEASGTFGRGKYTPELRLWKQIVDGVLVRARRATVSQASTTIEDVVGTARELSAAAATLDMGDVTRGALLEHNAPFNEEKYWDTQFGGSGAGRTSPYGFFIGLRRLQQKLFTAAQMAFQTLMDAAIADLEAGRGVASLDLAEQTLEGKLAALVNTADAIPVKKDWYPRPADPERLLASSEQTVEVTRSTFRGRPGGGGRHQDVFGSRKQASVGFQLYDATKSWGSEKELSIRRVFEVRRQQISLLRKIFASVGPTAKFELHGNDAWRTFLLGQLMERKKQGDDDTAALTFIVRLLEDYLAAFTIMSPNDIDEFGDNYLKRTFPRALTGQLIHDCGVYALRIAYALSLVRDLLGLEFRFVRLPSHLALTVSGKKIRGAFVFNNNQVFPVSASVLDGFRKAWAAQSGGMSAAASEDAFMGHIAAGTYIEKVDMPFRTTAVPSDPSGSALKNKLWSSYQAVTKTDVFGPIKDPSLDQFNLKYLSILDERKRIRNGFAFVLFGLWQKHGPALLRLAKAGPADPKYRAAAKAYRAALEAVRVGRRKSEESLRAQGAQIDALLKQNPKLIAPSASKASWQTLDPTFLWEKVLDDYLAQVDAAKPEPDFRFQFPTTD